MANSKPREILNELMGGMKEVHQTNRDQMMGFRGFMESVMKPGALDTKTKELISVGIAAYNRCEYCIVMHVYKALEAGATGEEIMEAAMTAVTFGGGASMAYTTTLLKDSIKEFENDFE